MITAVSSYSNLVARLTRLTSVWPCKASAEFWGLCAVVQCSCMHAANFLISPPNENARLIITRTKAYLLFSADARPGEPPGPGE